MTEKVNQGAKVDGVPHSPWHLLEHLRICQWDILEFSRNPDHVSPEFPDGEAQQDGRNVNRNRFAEYVRPQCHEICRGIGQVADPNPASRKIFRGQNPKGHRPVHTT